MEPASSPPASEPATPAPPGSATTARLPGPTASGSSAGPAASGSSAEPATSGSSAEPATSGSSAEPAASAAPAQRAASTSPGEEAGEGGDPARLANREVRSPRDMALSLAVIIVPIALLLIFYRVVLSGDAPVTVDPSSAIQEAQRAGAFPVAVPQGLGADWHVSSATFTKQANGATLRIGYVDPGKDPIQLVESSVPPATLLPAELTGKAERVSTFRAPNGVWPLYSGRPGEQGLVLAQPQRTIVVVGKAHVESLEHLAAALAQ